MPLKPTDMGIYDELSRLDENRSPREARIPVAATSHKATREVTPKAKRTHELVREESRANLRGTVRDESRVKSRENGRITSRELPTRDEIQEFSFRLRDAINVKVQAEVPHQWQEELELHARRLDVKKLELYRFILGEFLGKVRRQSSRP